MELCHRPQPRIRNLGRLSRRTVLVTRTPDDERKPIFCHGDERHEQWAFLLEKAFAKAHGCYENLIHGWATKAYTGVLDSCPSRGWLSGCPDHS